MNYINQTTLNSEIDNEVSQDHSFQIPKFSQFSPQFWNIYDRTPIITIDENISQIDSKYL